MRGLLFSAASAILTIVTPVLSSGQEMSMEEIRHPSVAIFPCLPGQSITMTEASFVTDRLTLEILKLGIYTVIDKYEIEKKISPAQFRELDTIATGAPFYQLAEKCNTPLFLRGTLTRTGFTVQLELYLHDVGARKVRDSVSISVPGSTLEIAEQIAPRLISLFNLSAFNQGGKVVYSRILPPSPASLVVCSSPPGATVSLNNTYKGLTPFEIDSIKAGDYLLSLDLRGYSSFCEKISVVPSKSSKMLVKLNKVFCSLTVRTTPPGAVVSLSNGITGKSPFTTDSIPAGNYLLRLFLKEYVPDSLPIMIRTLKHDTLNFSLIPQRFVDSVNGVRHRRNQLVRRIVFGGVTGTFMGFGIYYNAKAQQSINHENEAYSEYSRLNDANTPDEFSAAFKKYSNYKKDSESLCSTRNAHYILAGLSSVGLVLSIPF